MMQGTASTSATIEESAETALIEGLRTGDEQCYAHLVRQHGPSMLSRARYILQDEDDAHDALQLAFMAVFRNIRSFEQRARLSTWLHTVVSNAALTVHRRRARRARREQPLAVAAEFGSPPERGPECLLIDQQRRHALAAALDSLGAPYRAVIDSALAGHSSAETASRLSLNRSALKSRRFRAFRALRTQLAGANDAASTLARRPGPKRPKAGRDGALVV